MDQSGSARAMLYDLDIDRMEVSGKLSAGAGVGARYEHSNESIRLLAASSRSSGGAWSERGDCLRVA